MYAIVVPTGESWRLESSENDPGNCRTGVPSGATSCAPIGGVVTNGTLGAGGLVTEVVPEPGRDTSAKAPIAIAGAAATTIAPSRRFRDLRRCRSSCLFHESRSGSVCLVTMSKTSLRSCIGASFAAEHGSPLRGERADGRRTDAHDPCGLSGAVSVQIEQDEGGSLPWGEAPEHPQAVLADVDLVERIANDAERDRALRGPACGAQPHPVPVERHLEEVCGGIVDPVDRVPAFPELRERLLHQVGSVRTVPGHEVERLEQTPVLLLEEHPEVLRGRDPLRRKLHDLAYCLHHPSRRRGRHQRLGRSSMTEGSGFGERAEPRPPQVASPRSSSGTRSANSQAVQRSFAIRSHGRWSPRRSKCSPSLQTSRSKNDCAWRFFFGSTACGKSISVTSPSQIRTL